MQWYNSSFEEELQGTPLYNYIKQNCPKHWRRSLKYYQIITEKIVANPTEMLLPVIQKSGDKPLREIWNLVEEIKTDGGEILIAPRVFQVVYYCLDNLTLIPKKNCEKKFKEISDKHSPESILENNKGKTWSINNVYKNEFTIDSLMTTLEVVNIFKRKYPNDETIQNFEDIVREEICQIFGGTTIDID